MKKVTFSVILEKLGWREGVVGAVEQMRDGVFVCSLDTGKDSVSSLGCLTPAKYSPWLPT